MQYAEAHNEKNLLLRIAEGDEKAFNILFDLYKGRIFVYALKLSKSKHIAEEMVQEIFMKLWVNRKGLREVNNLGTYIFVLVRNRTVDHLRKIANESRLFDEVWKTISDRQRVTEEQLDAQESRHLIDEALGQLSIQKQKIFTMSRYEGLSHSQIAEKLSLSESTVKNHIVETLRHIKLFLQRHNGPLTLIFGFIFNRK